MDITKIKISLGIFFLLATFGVSFSIFAESDSASTKNIFEDIDQDGLSNEEEAMYGTDANDSDTDKDGYSDGTEVQSGYDPLKPAPGDKLFESESSYENERTDSGNDPNVTQDVSEKIAGMISDGEKDIQEITVTDIDSLIAEVMDESLSFDDLPEIDESRILVKEQSYFELSEEEQKENKKNDSLEYLTEISYVALHNLPHKISSENDIALLGKEMVSKTASLSSSSTSASGISYFKDLSQRMSDSLEQMEDIEVPENMSDLHKRGIQLMDYAVTLDQNLDDIHSDPIKSIVNLSKAVNLLSLNAEFLEDIDAELESLGIEEIPIDL